MGKRDRVMTKWPDALGQPLINYKDEEHSWDWDTMARWSPEKSWSTEPLLDDGAE